MDRWEAALAVNASLFLSNAIRKDTIVYINVEGEVISINGSKAKRVYPDSESLVGLFKAIAKGKKVPGVSKSECPEVKDYWCPGKEVKEEIFIAPKCFGLPLTAELVALQICLDRVLEGLPCPKGYIGSTVQSQRSRRNGNATKH